MKPYLLAAATLATALTACTSDEILMMSDAFAQTFEEETYRNSYAMGAGYSPYTPYGFSTYSGWPSGYAYGDYLGSYGCSSVGSFYTCDSDGDGYADMYGDTADGSYSSATMRVNGRGEAYAYNGSCACWERERSLDGPRKEYHERYDDYDDHRHRDRHDH